MIYNDIFECAKLTIKSQFPNVPVTSEEAKMDVLGEIFFVDIVIKSKPTKSSTRLKELTLGIIYKVANDNPKPKNKCGEIAEILEYNFDYLNVNGVPIQADEIEYSIDYSFLYLTAKYHFQTTKEN
jgi:hypothetical protein